MKEPKAKAYSLRIDARLVEPLQKLKKNNRRSLNAEINAAIQAWLGLADGNGSAPAQPLAGAEPAKSTARRKDGHPKKHRKAKAEVSAGEAAATTAAECD